MNSLGGFLDTLSQGAGRVITALNPPQTTVVQPAAAPSNGKAPLWVWLIGGVAGLALVGVLINFARKA